MKIKSPIIPRSKTDPVGTNDLELKAIRDFRARFKRIGDAYVKAFNQIPRSPVVNKNYEYRIDRAVFQSILDGAAMAVSSELLEGGKQSVWMFSSYVSTAYQRGTAQQFANLSRQSPVYHAARMSLRNIVMSDPYRRRIGLIAAREFEQMEGLTGDTKAAMSRVLSDGIGRGQNPTVVAKRLQSEAQSISRSRANRIARTEISNALRNARLDEAASANSQYGLTTVEMHLSALSPTSRITHIERHGKTYTIEQVQEFYSEAANAINCKCVQVSMLADDDGNPIVQSTVDRAIKQRKEYMDEHTA